MKKTVLIIIAFLCMAGVCESFASNPVSKKGSKEKAEVIKADVANSFQHAAIDVLVAKALKAVEKTGYRTVTVSGGVAANGYFRNLIKKAAEDTLNG